jgi:hypothetical protein
MVMSAGWELHLRSHKNIYSSAPLVSTEPQIQECNIDHTLLSYSVHQFLNKEGDEKEYVEMNLPSLL